MTVAPLTCHDDNGLTRVGVEGCPRGVSFAFVGRTGGVSVGDFATLNVDETAGDDPLAVEENRRRALATIGVSEAADRARTVVPRQVHGTDVVCVNASDAVAVASAQRLVASGADAVVVTAVGVPVLMRFADCVPVVLVAPHAFAVVHSGWRGALGRVASAAASELMASSHAKAGELWAYVGPHIAAASYEVSVELAREFVMEFGGDVLLDGRHVDLEAAVSRALTDVGVRHEHVVSCGIDTASATDAWFSHRASGGRTGRHAAVAWMPHLAAGRAGQGRSGRADAKGVLA